MQPASFSSLCIKLHPFQSSKWYQIYNCTLFRTEQGTYNRKLELKARHTCTIFRCAWLSSFYHFLLPKTSLFQRFHFVNLASTEVYCEATPSVFVKLCILMTILNTNYTDIKPDQIFRKLNDDFKMFVKSPDFFFISFIWSIIVAAFGVSRSVNEFLASTGANMLILLRFCLNSF